MWQTNLKQLNIQWFRCCMPMSDVECQILASHLNNPMEIMRLYISSLEEISVKGCYDGGWGEGGISRWVACCSLPRCCLPAALLLSAGTSCLQKAGTQHKAFWEVCFYRITVLVAEAVKRTDAPFFATRFSIIFCPLNMGFSTKKLSDPRYCKSKFHCQSRELWFPGHLRLCPCLCSVSEPGEGFGRETSQGAFCPHYTSECDTLVQWFSTLLDLTHSSISFWI